MTTKKKPTKRGRPARSVTPSADRWPKLFWFVHHLVPLEYVETPDRERERRMFIRHWKPRREIPVRLRSMKPVKRITPRMKRLVGRESAAMRAETQDYLFRRLMAEYPQAPVARLGRYAKYMRVRGT